MTIIDAKNAKAIKNLTNNKEVIKISDPNDPTKIYWQKITDVVVTYTINTGVATITIVGNDGVTYVNAASTSGSVNIPKGITITCSATVQTGYNAIPNTTQVLNSDYTYSPTTTIMKYRVTLASTYGHWEKNNVTVTEIENVPYGTTITKSGQTITVSGFGTYNFVVNSTDNYYTYSFNSIAFSSPVTAQMSVLGKATRSTRYYYLTFENDSNHTVTVYFRKGSGSWSSYSVDDTESKSVSTTYNESISVYFKYGGSTSSTITRSMTSDQTVHGNVSSTYHPSEFVVDNRPDGYTYEYNKGNWGYIHGSESCIGWSCDDYDYYDFNPIEHNTPPSTHVKITYNGTDYIAPLPSGLPSGMDGSSYGGEFDYTVWCSNGQNMRIWFYARWDSDGDSDWYDIVVQLVVGDYPSNWRNLLTDLAYGHYTEAYYTYSCWWN